MTDSEKLDLLLQKSTVLESEVGTLKEDVKEVKESQISLRQDMQGMEVSLRQDMQEMETSLRQDMQEMETSLRRDMQEMEKSQTSLRKDMQEMESSLRQDMKEMKEDISSLREEVHLTLENEVTPNVNIIAEGHLELSRKLNECIHISSDIKAKQEILDVFINLQKANNRLKAL